MGKQVIDTHVSNVRVMESNIHNNKSMGKSLYSNNIVKNCRDNCVEVESTVLDNCTNTPVTPIGLSSGVVARIPVVLAEFTIRFNLHAYVDLPEQALEIKNVKKRIKITQCILLQPTNVLFIKGFVRKVIDYTTRKCSKRDGVCGEIHHCTIDVPFECSTPISFTTPPATLLTNTEEEFEYFRRSELPNQHFAEKDHLLSGDLSEINQFKPENFNELPFCDLITANIYEFDEFIGREASYKDMLPFEEGLFSRLEEKMVIELTLQLLQNRRVSIGSTSGRDNYRCDD